METNDYMHCLFLLSWVHIILSNCLLFTSCSHVWSVLLDFFWQDLPGAIDEEELAKFLHKELDERPYTFQAVSAYDG